MSRSSFFVSIMSLALAATGVFGQASLGTGFTYQGSLASSNSPATGTYDMSFKLFDAVSGGAQIGSTVCRDNVSVSAGLFTVPLDFGAIFGDNARYLEIGVKADTTVGNCNAATHTVLSPRQQVTPSPAAVYSVSTRGLTVDTGGRVGVGAAAAGPFSVFASPADQVNNPSTFTNVSTPMWQSFTAGRTGKLSRVEILNQSGNCTILVRIYSGEGTGGTLLTSQSTSASSGFIDIDLSLPPTVSQGSVYTLELTLCGGGGLTIVNNGNTYGGGRSSIDPNRDMAFSTFVTDSSVPALAVLTTGNVGVGTLGASDKLTINGNARANNFFTPSSIRFKENVSIMTDALDCITAVDAVRFDWKAPYAAERGRISDFGFLAEEVEKTFPEVVRRDENGAVVGMDYSRLCAVAIQAVKELRVEKDAQIAAVRADKDRELAELRERLSRLEAAQVKER